jgi:hypothetical protein
VRVVIVVDDVVWLIEGWGLSLFKARVVELEAVASYFGRR